MYRGELPGLRWDDEKKRYFSSREGECVNLSADEPVMECPTAGQVPTNGAVVGTLKKARRRRADDCGICFERRNH